MINFDKLIDNLLVVYRFIYTLFAINIMMIVATLLGLIIFGFFPALIASYMCINEFLNDKRLIRPIRTYKNYFKKYFFIGNIYGILIFFGLFLLIQDFRLVFYQPTNFPTFILLFTFISFIITIYVTIALLIYFPLVSMRNECNLFVKIKYSLIIFFSKPLKTIAIIFINCLIIYLMSHMLVLIPIFGFTLLILNSIILYDNLILKRKETYDTIKNY